MTNPVNDQAPATAPRRRGAPKGNRNALKHGRYSAAAKAAREAERSRLFRHLAIALEYEDSLRGKEQRDPDQGEASVTEHKEALPNKRINSATTACTRGAPKGNRNALKDGRKSLILREYILRRRALQRKLAGERAFGSNRPPAAITGPKQQTTPVHKSPKGGAPKGNRNALKTGRYTAENKARKRHVAALIRRAYAVVAGVEKQLPKRKPGPRRGPSATGARIPSQGG